MAEIPQEAIMPAKDPTVEKPLLIPADLDVAGAIEAHAELISKLGASDQAISLDLEDGSVTPLALQLVASAARSFPPDNFRLGPRAAAALGACETPKT